MTRAALLVGMLLATLAWNHAAQAQWKKLLEQAVGSDVGSKAASAALSNDEVIAGLKEALARQPNHVMAADDLAWILASQQTDLDGALALAQLALRYNRSTKTLTTLGWVRHQRGEYDEAIENYRVALEADATLPTVRYRLSLSLIAGGRIEEAREVLSELIRGPGFPELEAARIEFERIKDS